MTEADSRHVFEAGSGIIGPLSANATWLADLGDLVRNRQRSEPLTPEQLKRWAERLCDECFEQVSVERYLLPTGSMRNALSIFVQRGKARFVLALPKKTDSEKELLLYFEGDLMPTQVQIDEIAQWAHDIYKDCFCV